MPYGRSEGGRDGAGPLPPVGEPRLESRQRGHTRVHVIAQLHRGFMDVLRQLGGLLVRGIECMSDMHSIGRDARVVIMTAARSVDRHYIFVNNCEDS